jgi:DNA-binding beta-propeller fold protein YncE
VRRGGLAVALLHFRDRCGNGKAFAKAQPLAFAVADRVARPMVRNGYTRPLSFSARPAALPSAPGHRIIQTVAERVLVGGAPFDIVVAGRGDVLITRTHASAVDILHLDPLRVAHTIRVSPAPTRVVPGGRSQWVYVTSQFAEAVCIVDLERKEQVGVIPVPGHALGAAMAPDGVTLFVTTNQDRLVAVSSLQRSVTNSAAIPLACPELTLHPTGRWIYAPCWRAGIVVEVDAATLNIVRRFDVGGIPQEAVVSSDGQTLYVANESGWLDVIHLPSGRRTATIEFATAAFGVAVSADEQYILVSLMNAGRIIVLQRQGLAQRAAIPTGGRPRHMIAAPRGDGMLVVNEGGWIDLLR